MPAPPDQDIQDLFKRHFGFRPAHLTRAPAKLELLGSLAEPTDGLAVTAAVDRYAWLAASPRTDGKIELVHADRAPEIFWITEPKANPTAPWADTFKAVLRELRLRKVHFSGFNVALHQDIPAGLGLGEHAALSVATALTVRKLFPFGLGDSGATVPPKRNDRDQLPALLPPERAHFARICRSALSNSGHGEEGWVESLTSLGGKAWHALNLDCRFQSLEHASFVGTALIVCDSGQHAPATIAQRQEVLEHGRAAVIKLGAKSVRSLEPKAVRAAQARLTEREFACALHLTGETQRAAAAERALREEDHRQLGSYLTLSHESHREVLPDYSPEADCLVELALKLPGCLGARTLGHGLGATVNLVSYHEAEPFMAQIAQAFEARTQLRLRPFVCQIVDGAE
jgi:galactokinase